MFPTPYTVQTRTYRQGPGRDPRGSLIESWDFPVSQSVIGWAAPQSTEPKVIGHDRVVIEVELFVPPGFRVGPKDRVIIPATGVMPAKEYFAVGYPEDFCFGPFAFQPGYVVNLIRAEG
ncbi:hypothetical protein SAMN05421776_11759 [Nocardia farcinica]|uniref:Head-to-tail stopper n=1 Tax=Nocardia farcinica TaxID=37329 RepID=A0A0H5NVQ8_NOCFR|nr:hypothetical protein CJ469_05666 [Nocardia farcinica]PFX06104.1 hypothetical protein CJ468_04964 [Nocardia farcinica]CRY79885.1 Uncharacterised protein [Nocardia farcinica]SIT33656.1 hypothetical protein SAMN05421776_11759 [Nocardia farcinica]